MLSWFCGSAQPRVMILSYMLALSSTFHGRDTNQTLRLAAGSQLDNESVMLAVPEICRSSLSRGVVYNNLCGELLTRARYSPASETSSISISFLRLLLFVVNPP